MKNLLILVIFLIVTVTSIAQVPENHVILEQPTNIRSGSGGHYAVRGVVNNGILSVTGKTDFDSPICTGIWSRDVDMWLRVDLEGVEGWVKFCIVDFEGDINNLPIVEPSSPLIRRPTRYVYYGIASGFRADELGSEPSSINMIAPTRYDHINVRDKPQIDSEIIEILTAEKVYIIGQNANSTWIYVTYSGISPYDRDSWWRGLQTQSGWIASYLVTKPDGWQNIVPVLEN